MAEAVARDDQHDDHQKHQKTDAHSRQAITLIVNSSLIDDDEARE